MRMYSVCTDMCMRMGIACVNMYMSIYVEGYTGDI